jgi:hypothetical protein
VARVVAPARRRHQSGLGVEADLERAGIALGLALLAPAQEWWRWAWQRLVWFQVALPEDALELHPRFDEGDPAALAGAEEEAPRGTPAGVSGR